MANETTLVSFYLEALVAAVADEYKSRIPSVVEFSFYYKMATQGMIYRCIMFNLMMRNAPREICREQLRTLVDRTVDAAIDHSLFNLLAVGR